MKTAVIITAAGTGNRMGAGVNKILLPLNGKTVIEHSLIPFSKIDSISTIVITYNPNDLIRLQKLFEDSDKQILFVEGASSRQESVFNGLLALLKISPDSVLIHDGARPFVSKKLIQDILFKSEKCGPLIPVISSVNAMKLIDTNGIIIEHLKREKTVSAQTPQAFPFAGILKCYHLAKENNYLSTDDSELWNTYMGKVHTMDGELKNIKITYKKDLQIECE